MECPVCGETLAHVSFHGVAIDLGYACRGIWLDAGELASLLGEEEQSASLLGSRKLYRRSWEKERHCPRCGTGMKKWTLGIETPVVVDICPENHGEWFDRGELLSLLQQGGLDLSNMLVQLLERILVQDPEGE